jgi:TRAP-type C4-dicarboxylate transport system permease small subunit
MTYLNLLDRLLSKVESVLLIVFLGTMLVLAFAQVILRNVFGTGLVWADTIVRHLVLWAGFIGAALATGEGKHISIDALTKFLPAHIRLLAQVVTSLFAVFACYFLANAAWTFLRAEYAEGVELVLSIPTWAALLIIPVGYGLMAVHFVVKAVGGFYQLVRAPREGS